MKASLAERWTAAVNAAVDLSTPAEIVAHIRTADAPDDGLRAGSYEARVRTGHRSDSHPERLALDQRGVTRVLAWWKDADTLAVSRAGLRFIDAINAINASRDHGTAATWADAVKDAHLMAELHDGNFIRSCIDVANDLGPYHDTIRAIEALTKLAHRWGCPHIATIQERLRHPDVCLSHARIGEERPVCGILVLCKTCRDWMDEAGLDVPAIHRDTNLWPTLEMLRANEDGRKTDLRRAKADWHIDHAANRDGPRRSRFRVS